MRSLLVVAFIGMCGVVLWQLLSVQSRPALVTRTNSGGFTDLPHQLTIESGQALSLQLQETEIALDRTQVALLEPTLTPTKAPTSTPKAELRLPSCEPSSGLADGTLCDAYPTPTPKVTPIPSPTPEPCATVFAEPLPTFSRQPCYFDHTPTPETEGI